MVIQCSFDGESDMLVVGDINGLVMVVCDSCLLPMGQTCDGNTQEYNTIQ